MIYAPVCIPTLNRYEHLKACIESLQRNSWAQYTDLYIGLDFPPSQKYEEGYAKVTQYLNEGIIGFNQVKIFKQKLNLGASENMWKTIDAALCHFDRFIILEDDNIVSRDFLEYMDKCLDYFYEDKRVNMIGGYTSMVLEEQVNNNNANIFAVHDGNGWGLGTWKENWQNMRKDINKAYFEAAACDIRKVTKIKYKRSLCKFIDYLSADKEIPFQDSTMNIYMQMNNMCKILPTETKVLNRGWDGTGLNCGINDSYLKQEMKDNQSTFSLITSPDLLTAKRIRANDAIVCKIDNCSVNARRWFRLIIFYIFTPRRVNEFMHKWAKCKHKVKKIFKS